jgi:pyruvate formate lyase activating enzyme
MLSVSATPVETLERAHGIARETGLQFVYVGNVPGHPLNSTYCPSCNELLIIRMHFEIVKNRIADGSCPTCGTRIPGVWRETRS